MVLTVRDRGLKSRAAFPDEAHRLAITPGFPRCSPAEPAWLPPGEAASRTPALPGLCCELRGGTPPQRLSRRRADSCVPLPLPAAEPVLPLTWERQGGCRKSKGKPPGRPRKEPGLDGERRRRAALSLSSGSPARTSLARKVRSARGAASLGPCLPSLLTHAWLSLGLSPPTSDCCLARFLPLLSCHEGPSFTDGYNMFQPFRCSMFCLLVLFFYFFFLNQEGFGVNTGDGHAWCRNVVLPIYVVAWQCLAARPDPAPALPGSAGSRWCVGPWPSPPSPLPLPFPFFLPSFPLFPSPADLGLHRTGLHRTGPQTW